MKKSIKYTLLGLIPAVAVPSVTVASIYGTKTNKQSLSHNLSDKEIEETLAEEFKEIYKESPELRNQGLEEFALKNIKEEVGLNQFTVSRYQLRKMIRNIVNNATSSLQSNIEDFIIVREAKAMDELFTAYEQKLLKWEMLSKEVPSVPSDLLPEDTWLQGVLKRHLNKKVDKASIKHKEHLIILINELDDQISYLEELRNAIERAEYVHYVNQVRDEGIAPTRRINAIPTSMTRIPDGLYENFNFKEKFFIPSWVTTIGKRAFYGADLSKGIAMRDSVIEIEDQAFANAQINNDFRMPRVRKLGNSVFQNVVLPVGFEADMFWLDNGKITHENAPHHGIFWEPRRGDIGRVEENSPRFRVEKPRQ